MQFRKVLVLIDWYLPGYKAGGPIQSLANLVDQLKSDFNFSIITRDTDYQEQAPYANLVADQWIDKDGVKIRYCSDNKLNYSNLKLELLAEVHDVVYLNSMFSFYFTFIPLWILKGRSHEVVLAPRGMLSKSALKIKPLRKRIYLFLCSILGLFKGIRFQATSEQEIKDIQAVFGHGSKIHFAPNIPASVPEELNEELCVKESGSVNLISVARIAPEKNLLYALNVLKHVKARVKFDIYGIVYSQQYWTTCEELIASMPENITVKEHGGVTRAELFPLLKKSHFLFLPSKGENFGHIIIECLSSGCPVIISDQTPWRSLESSNVGYDIGLAEEDKFINAIEDCANIGQEEYDGKSASSIAYADKYKEESGGVKLNKALFSS
ncbi:MAG: glycosyltransferase [Flavobacteriales bacterium]|nr:glycosyltransferase [Flavobacteriales bacterium]